MSLSASVCLTPSYLANLQRGGSFLHERGTAEAVRMVIPRHHASDDVGPPTNMAAPIGARSRGDADG
jgi:hypothetical protein